MPEISEQDFAALAAQVASLSSALAVARRRIDDLEEGMTDHIGLDWGESLVDVNSPHPNISANTIESGGGIIRQDENGMQVQTDTGSVVVPAIYFVHRLDATPAELASKAYVSGLSNEPYYGLAVGAINSSGEAEVNVGANNNVPTQTVGISGLVGLRTEQEALTTGTYGDWVASNRFTHSLLTIAASVGAATITGMVNGSVPTSTGAALSDYRILINNGAYTITLKNEDTGSLASSRFAIGADIVLAPGAGVSLFYDAGYSNRWICAGYWGGSVAATTAAWALTADISPSQITSTQNDYAPTGFSACSVMRLSTDASRDITGLAGGADGRVILIFNVGSFDIVLKDEDAGSTAANRFALNGDITLQPDNSTGLWYDSTSSRWRAF